MKAFLSIGLALAAIMFIMLTLSSCSVFKNVSRSKSQTGVDSSSRQKHVNASVDTSSNKSYERLMLFSKKPSLAGSAPAPFEPSSGYQSTSAVQSGLDEGDLVMLWERLTNNKQGVSKVDSGSTEVNYNKVADLTSLTRQVDEHLYGLLIKIALIFIGAFLILALMLIAYFKSQFNKVANAGTGN